MNYFKEILQYTFSTLLICNLYIYRVYYINSIINIYSTIKYKLYSLYRKKKTFNITKVLLYTNLEDNYDVTRLFHRNIVKTYKIDIELILNFYSSLNILFKYNDNIRLKIYFNYNNIDYIIYYRYIPYLNNYYVPYPPYSEEIMNNYRHDIINPFYQTITKKKYFYSLFNMESKDIEKIEINNEMKNDLLKYFAMIKTPFNDYGILYNVPVKLLWLLVENNIDINNFYKFYLKFQNMYINENFELNEHFIEMNKEDVNEFIISDRMKEIMEIKNKDMIK